MADDTKDRIHRKVDRASRFPEGRGKVFRTLWVIGGVTVILAGLAMTVLPGPALIVLPLGIAMLAAEFDWARRLLGASIDRGVDVQRRLARPDTKTKIVSGLVVAGAIAAVAFIVLR